jgi:thioredoxin 1
MNNFTTMISGTTPTLVDFYASWCGPCKAQAPILEQVKHKFGDKIRIIKVDVDVNEALAAHYRVQSVPTLILFVDGAAVWRASGVHQAEFLQAKVNEYL